MTSDYSREYKMFTQDMKFEEMFIKPKEVVLPKHFRECCVFCNSAFNLRKFNGGLNQDGEAENCIQMLMSCFYIKLIDPRCNGWLCETCVSRLRDAIAFRTQVETAGQLQGKAEEGCGITNEKLGILKHEPDIKEEDSYIIDDDSFDLIFVDAPSDVGREEKQEDKDNITVNWKSWEELNRIPWSEDECTITQNKDSKRIEWFNQPQFPKASNTRLVLNNISNQCPICEEVITVRSKLIEHFESHVPKSLCEYCGKEYASWASLREHLNSHKGKLPCPQCSKKFVRKVSLLQHVRSSHNRERTFPCPDCDDIFATYLMKRKHQFEKHGVWYNRHTCPECNKDFFNATRLDRHVRRTHRGERNMPCPECGLMFFDKSAVAMHALTHSDTRNFVCDLCGKGFKNKKDLRMHLNIHYNIRNQKCTICGQAFIQWMSLQVHMKSRHKDVPRTKNK